MGIFRTSAKPFVEDLPKDPQERKLPRVLIENGHWRVVEQKGGIFVIESRLTAPDAMGQPGSSWYEKYTLKHDGKYMSAVDADIVLWLLDALAGSG